MQMRRANKIALTMGSAALLVAGAVIATPPKPYDQWQATKLGNGTTEIQNSAGTSLADNSPVPPTLPAAPASLVTNINNIPKQTPQKPKKNKPTTQTKKQQNNPIPWA